MKLYVTTCEHNFKAFVHTYRNLTLKKKPSKQVYTLGLLPIAVKRGDSYYILKRFFLNFAKNHSHKMRVVF